MTATHGWTIDDEPDLTPTEPPPSPKQQQFITDLAAEVHGDDADTYLARLTADGRWTRQHASTVIEELLDARSRMTRPETTVPEGLHHTDGQIYRVKRSAASGNLYTTALNPKTGKWDYTGRKPLAHLDEGTTLTVEAARAWGVNYGICCVCGRTLTDPTSVNRGIGPICETRL